MPMKTLIIYELQQNAYKKHMNKKLIIHSNTYNGTNDMDTYYNGPLTEP